MVIKVMHNPILCLVLLICLLSVPRKLTALVTRSITVTSTSSVSSAYVPPPPAGSDNPPAVPSPSPKTFRYPTPSAFRDDEFNNENQISVGQVEKEASYILDSNTPVGLMGKKTIDYAINLILRISEVRHKPEVSVTLEKILHRLTQEQAAGNTRINNLLMAPLYIALIGSWSRSGEMTGLERAQEILEHMVTEYQVHDEEESIATTALIDNNMTETSTDSKNNKNTDSDLPESSATKTDNDSNENGGRRGEWPQRETCNLLLWAYARSGLPDGPAKAVRFLSKWFDWYESNQCSFTPNSISYAAILHALAQQNPSRHGGGAEDKYSTNRHSHRHKHDSSSVASDSSPEMFLSTLNRSVQNTADENNDDDDDGEESSTTTFHTRLLDNRQIVLSLLMKMEKLSEQYPAVKPDVLCYHQYFVALESACRRHEIPDREAAILAENHLVRMLKHPDPDLHPNSWSFQSVFRRWAFADLEESAERFERLIRLQEDYHAAKGFTRETRPLISSYNTLMRCYARSNQPDKVERAYQLVQRLGSESNTYLPRPDSILYNTLLNLIAKSGSPVACDLVAEILSEMERKQKEGDPFVQVDVTAYNSFLVACVRSNRVDAFGKVEAVVSKMRNMAMNGRQEMAPNRYSYDVYLRALARTKRRDSIEKAEVVLDEMHELHEKGFPDVKPDIYTYTNVLNCFAVRGRKDCLERAVALLDHLEDDHSEGQAAMRPHRLTYNCCVNAIAKSTQPGKAKVALDILRRMQSAAVAPLVETYNNVLNACAFSVHPDDDSEEVLRIATSVFEEARQTVGANHITYLTMLRVVNTQISDKEARWHWVRELVHLCAQDGQLTKPIMHGASLNVSPVQYEQLRLQVIDHATEIFSDNGTSRKLEETSQTTAAFTRSKWQRGYG